MKLFFIELTEVGNDDPVNLTAERLEEVLNDHCLPDDGDFPNAKFIVKEVKSIPLSVTKKDE